MINEKYLLRSVLFSYSTYYTPVLISRKFYLGSINNITDSKRTGEI